MPVIFMMLGTITCSVVMEIQSLGYYLKGKASLRYPKPLHKIVHCTVDKVTVCMLGNV